MKKRLSIFMGIVLAVGCIFSQVVFSEPSLADEALPGESDAASGEAIRPYLPDAKYSKKVSYKTIRKKLKSRRSRAFVFKDVSKKKSVLTHYGFFYKAFKIPHTGYGDYAETILLWPTITAKKSGSTSTLSLGMKVRSIVQIHGKTKRKYKKMIISGGGESITLSGSSSSKTQRKGEYLNILVTTNASFTLSKNKTATDSKIEKLRRVFSSNNLKITVKDSAKKKTYKCSIGSSSTQVMLDILNDYKSILKKYKK